MIPARPAVGRLAATAVLLALIAAGCGSGGDDTATTDASASTAAATGQSAASVVPADNSGADDESADSTKDGSADSSDDDGGADSANDNGAGSSSVPDPCTLVTDQAASALVGQDVTGVAAPIEDVPYAACQWGELVDGHMLAVQVAGELDGIRYLQALTTASAQAATPSAIGADGKYFADVGYIYGGGGVGQSVLFRHGDWDVLVGLTGEDGPTQAELEALAADVDAALP